MSELTSSKKLEGHPHIQEALKTGNIAIATLGLPGETGPEAFEGYPHIQEALKTGNIAITTLGLPGETGPEVKVKIVEKSQIPDQQLTQPLHHVVWLDVKSLAKSTIS